MRPDWRNTGEANACICRQMYEDELRDISERLKKLAAELKAADDAAASQSPQKTSSGADTV